MFSTNPVESEYSRAAKQATESHRHMAVNIQRSEFNRGSPGDFSGEGGQSNGTSRLFQAALHQQVSPQTGREISKQRKNRRASCRNKVKRATLLRMIRK